jgi:hypothetical protein
MHRDFQSKNIHFKHGRIRIIDRQGPMLTSGRKEKGSLQSAV